MTSDSHIRISEWASVSVDGLLTGAQREAVAEASDAWRETNGLNDAPLSFSGPRGEILCARQFVGVVEVGDVTVEIYPKLDRHLLSDRLVTSEDLADSAMQSLLWMLEVSGYMDISETDTARLQEERVSFYDVFAYLMAKNLIVELQSGVPHAYVTVRDAVPAVKGRINILEQVTTHWNRFDRVACIWDEFTPDIPLNRLFKCACRVLNERVANQAVSKMLIDCLMYLDPVADLSPAAALQAVEGFRWDRSNERLKMCFNMAVRLLAGTGYRMAHGAADTFVFMMDMNQLFEDYAACALEARFGVPVDAQKNIGKLFADPRRLSQYPDYLWEVDGKRWIGDAKYKHLAAGQRDALSFADMESDGGEGGVRGNRADQVLSTNDVRQLIVYAELLRRRDGLTGPPDVAILYPFVGSGTFAASRAEAFNGSTFWMVPIKVKRVPNLSDTIPHLAETIGGTDSIHPHDVLVGGLTALLNL
jgi:5-methylcytosine-specific restriction enzyme subunit McrC